MNISWSTVWIALIGFGAILVAIGGIQFNLARDREKGEAAGHKALSMLVGECRRNLTRIESMRQVTKEGKIQIEGFETTAWSVVSSGGLLVQVEKETLEEITEAYYLVELANKYHAHILDMSAGVLSALGGVENTRSQYMNLLRGTLDAVEPKLKRIVERQKG